MTGSKLTLGLVQVTSTTSVERNAALTEPLIRSAAEQGAQTVSDPAQNPQRASYSQIVFVFRQQFL